jgi:enterochelin esterase-like enzyme
VADTLIWNGTTPPFAALLLQAGPGSRAAVVAAWDRVTLPVRRLGSTIVLPFDSGGDLSTELAAALTSPAVQRAERGADGVLPHGWTRIVAGPAGGTVWQGVIPDTVVPGAHRASLVYLPPSTSTRRRYPVIYLLHGLRGSPYSFIGGMRLAAIADDLIRAQRAPPFIAVLPPAGTSIAYDGEWAGPWERYVVQDVVPWARSHLPIHPEATIGGLSAGGYGALDIGLRHPGLFGTLESYSGYYRAPHDGPFVGASPALLRANDPTRLVRREAAVLRARGVRIYLACGAREHRLLARTRAFAAVLQRAGIPHRVVETPGGHTGKTWRHQLIDALRFALTR